MFKKNSDSIKWICEPTFYGLFVDKSNRKSINFNVGSYLNYAQSVESKKMVSMGRATTLFAVSLLSFNSIHLIFSENLIIKNPIFRSRTQWSRLGVIDRYERFAGLVETHSAKEWKVQFLTVWAPDSKNPIFFFENFPQALLLHINLAGNNLGAWVLPMGLYKNIV